MKQIFFLVFFFAFSLLGHAQGRAQTQAGRGSREGVYGGLSLGYQHYSTFWYYHNGSGSGYYDNYAKHHLNRVVISLSLEKAAVFQAGSFDFDLGGALLLAPYGNAKADYLPGDNSISSGGWGAGLNFYGRAVYKPADSRFLPFAAFGPQYMFLHNNGKKSGAAAMEYGYTDGWNEGILLAGLSLGVDMPLEDWIVTPELRFGLFGWSSSSWSPHGRDVSMNGGPGLIAFSLCLSKKL